MSFFGKIAGLFHRKKEIIDSDAYEQSEINSDASEGYEELFDRREVDLEDMSLGKKPTVDDVRRYLDDAGARIALMNERNEQFRKEYDSVTNYLSDIQIIDSIAGDSKKKLGMIAAGIVKIEEDIKNRMGREHKIDDVHFGIMKQYEESMNEQLIYMKKSELYQADIKNDMKYLDEEKKRLYKEQKERRNKSVKVRGLALGLCVLIVSVMVLLGILWGVTGTDMTLAFIAVIAFAGGLILYVFNGMQKNRYELLMIDKKLNKCISLLNSVKIKYINNTTLLDYICSKYRISNSLELEKIWTTYIEIKDNEEALLAGREELENLKNELEKMLKEYGVKDSGIWTCQAAALLDDKEMVEVRHGLNQRRQKLRKQIGYNDDLIRRDAIIMQKFLKKKPQLGAVVASIIKKYAIEDTLSKSLK
ncbi:MAG: DUF2207 domain-containing protein [Lachnospiraceae bacterium]|nr:DUF2207 domain-containing protein [Lachnospiraceae bacterium]